MKIAPQLLDYNDVAPPGFFLPSWLKRETAQEQLRTEMELVDEVDELLSWASSKTIVGMFRSGGIG
jgi:hypothetical protein